MKSAQLLFNVGKKLQLAFAWSLLPGLLMLLPPVVFAEYLLLDTNGIMIIGGLTSILMVLFSTMSHGIVVGGLCFLLNLVWGYFSLVAMTDAFP